MAIAQDDNVDCSISSGFGGLHVVVEVLNVPVTPNTSQHARYLRGAAGKNRPTASDVLHLGQAHRPEPRELVEDLGRSLESLPYYNFAGLTLNELSKADGDLFFGGTWKSARYSLRIKAAVPSSSSSKSASSSLSAGVRHQSRRSAPARSTWVRDAIDPST
jgi:hypothetical protein